MWVVTSRAGPSPAGLARAFGGTRLGSATARYWFVRVWAVPSQTRVSTSTRHTNRQCDKLCGTMNVVLYSLIAFLQVSIKSYTFRNTVQLDNPNSSNHWMRSKHRILQITEFKEKLFFSKNIVSEDLWVQFILYGQGLKPADVWLHSGMGQAVIGLHLSPPRGARPLSRNVKFHANLFLLQAK